MTQVDERSRLVNKLLVMWENYSELFRTYPERYETLLAEKKRLRTKIKTLTLDALPRRVLEEYPKIPFFEIIERENVRNELKKMDLKELKRLERELDKTLKYNSSWLAVSKTVRLYECQIKMATSKKPFYGTDPSACTGGRRLNR